MDENARLHAELKAFVTAVHSHQPDGPHSGMGGAGVAGEASAAVAMTEEHLRDVTEQLDLTEQELDLLLQQHQRTTASNSELQRVHADLERNNQVLQDRVNELSHELAAAQDASQQLEQTGDRLAAARIALKRRLAEADEKCDMLESAYRELCSLMAPAIDMSDQALCVQQATDMVADVQRQTISNGTPPSTTGDNAGGANLVVPSSSLSMLLDPDRARAVVEKYVHSRQYYEKQLRAYRDAVETLGAQCADAKKNEHDATEHARTAAETLHECILAKDAALVRAEQLAAELARQTEQVRALNGDVAHRVRTALAAHDRSNEQRIAELQATVDALTKRKIDAETTLARVQRECTSLRSDLERCKSAHDATHAQHESQLDATLAKQRRAEAAQAAAEATAQELRAELHDAAVEAERQQQTTRLHRDALQRDVSRLSSELSRTQNDLVHATEVRQKPRDNSVESQ